MIPHLGQACLVWPPVPAQVLSALAANCVCMLHDSLIRITRQDLRMSQSGLALPFSRGPGCVRSRGAHYLVSAIAVLQPLHYCLRSIRTVVVHHYDLIFQVTATGHKR